MKYAKFSDEFLSYFRLDDNGETLVLTDKRGYSRAVKLLTYEERSQGEWVAREDMDFLDENEVVHKHFQCNHCGLIHDFIDGHTPQYNFCPQCGYRLKGGAE